MISKFFLYSFLLLFLSSTGWMISWWCVNEIQHRLSPSRKWFGRLWSFSDGTTTISTVRGEQRRWTSEWNCEWTHENVGYLDEFHAQVCVVVNGWGYDEASRWKRFEPFYGHSSTHHVSYYELQIFLLVCHRWLLLFPLTKNVNWLKESYCYHLIV